MFIERPSALAMARQALADNAATLLLGPRQVGKSTLARAVAAERSECVYLDLELDADLRKLCRCLWQ
jgi:predicted AAA+ superfamily ATPase